MKSVFLAAILVFQTTLLFAEGERSRILSARFVWSNLWDLSEDIEVWAKSEQEDAKVTKKLLKILSWKRSYLFAGQNTHLRRLKRAATDALAKSKTPSPEEIIHLSRSLDAATFTPNVEGNYNNGDYTYIAETLVEWAQRGNLVALEEVLRAIESDSVTKVFETELALARSLSSDSQWLVQNSDALSRVKKALGRPWVFELLRHYYEKDLRFNQHAKNQLYIAIDTPISAPLRSEDLSTLLSSEDTSLFHFLNTLNTLCANPKQLQNKDEASYKIAEAIERIINANPKLIDNVYFATHIMRSIELFGLHNPFIDNLVASWTTRKFTLHNRVVQGPEFYEKNLIREIRDSALDYLARIQQNHFFTESRARLAKSQAGKTGNVLYIDTSTVHPNPSPLSNKVLRIALESAEIPNVKKLKLINDVLVNDPYIQGVLLNLALDPNVQAAALDLLNKAESLSHKQLARLASIIGFSSAKDADYYLLTHTHLRAQYNALPASVGLFKSCRASIRRWLKDNP